MQTRLEIVDIERRGPSTFDQLYQSGLYLAGYYPMGFMTYGAGIFEFIFDGAVSEVVEKVICALLMKKFGTKVLRSHH